MPWVRFTGPFDWKPKPAVTLAYPPGFIGNVTSACADAAKAVGKAVTAKNPKGRGNGSGQDANEASAAKAGD